MINSFDWYCFAAMVTVVIYAIAMIVYAYHLGLKLGESKAKMEMPPAPRWNRIDTVLRWEEEKTAPISARHRAIQLQRKGSRKG